MITAAQQNAMNTELWQGIGYIADDEILMRRLSKYVKRLAKEKADDPTLMTKEEFFARVDEAQKGPSMEFASVEELDKYIRSL